MFISKARFSDWQLLPVIKDGGRILNVSSGLARFYSQAPGLTPQ